MLTVTVGLESSGSSNSFSPFSRRYSVIPSTVAILLTPLGSAKATPWINKQRVVQTDNSRRRGMRRLRGKKTRQVAD